MLSFIIMTAAMRKRKSSDSSNSDEESAQAVEPLDGFGDGEDLSSKDSTRIRTLFLHLLQGKAWWTQCITIFVAAFLTYSFNNVGSKINVHVAIMTVITIVGASPFRNSHLVLASIGAFVGGQNVIASTNDNENIINSTNYLWLLLLSVVVGLVWCFVIVPYKILDGYAGRLGTTTFIGFNVTMMLFFGPLHVVQWKRYIFGVYQVVLMAEEDTTLDVANVWEWADEAELAIGYCISVLWLGVAGGAIRIFHNNTNPSEALNNVLIPCLLALLSMLVVNSTAYNHAYGLYNGFAVGAYVAMASLQKIHSIMKLALISFTAALWGLLLTPFFVGFAGKSGFTAMLGHKTFEIIELFIKKYKHRLRQEEMEVQLSNISPEESHQQQQSLQSTISVSHDESSSLLMHHPHSHKPQRENSVLLKHQRRQKSRLRHYQDQTQESGSTSSKTLQHRGWSATTQTSAADGWQHTLESQRESNNLE